MSAVVDQPAVKVLPVDWLPRYGRNAMYFPEPGVVAVSYRLWQKGAELEAILSREGVKMLKPEPNERFVLKVTCPLCGRNIPGKRPTVNDLGLLRHHDSKG